MLETIHRIGGQVLRADRPDPLPEPGDRTRPPDPLGEHRRRIRGYAVNRARMRGSTSLIGRRRRSPLVLRRTIIGQRTGHRVSRDAQLPCDSPLRQPFAEVKMPDQGPVFQGDHPSNLIGWPTFQPSRLAGFSTVVNRCPVVCAGGYGQFLTSAQIDAGPTALHRSSLDSGVCGRVTTMLGKRRHHASLSCNCRGVNGYVLNRVTVWSSAPRGICSSPLTAAHRASRRHRRRTGVQGVQPPRILLVVDLTTGIPLGESLLRGRRMLWAQGPVQPRPPAAPASTLRTAL